MTFKAEFANVRFKVAESEGRLPYITTLENGPTTNTILNDKTSFLMTLKKGISFEVAQELVEHMNQYIQQISIQPH
jgi:hypothetical protein